MKEADRADEAEMKYVGRKLCCIGVGVGWLSRGPGVTLTSSFADFRNPFFKHQPISRVSIGPFNTD